MKLANGKLIGTGIDSSVYMRNVAPRGSKEFVLSRSDLMAFAECPSKWISGGGRDEEDTRFTIWGSLIDCLLTDGARFGERFAIKPATYPVRDKAGNPTGEEKPWNANSTWCKEWMEAQGQRICIDEQDEEESHAAVQRLYRDPSLFSILNSSDFQVYVTAEYQDPTTGLSVPIKALLDIVPKADSGFAGSVLDFKTARSANPATWGRALYQQGYHVQGAMQLDIYNAASGEKRSEFRHIVQENTKPYEISKPWISSEFIALGRNTYRNALALYARCLATGHWPTYDDLQRETYSGWSMISPEAWMVSNEPVTDPDWVSEAL